jgi:hypothetical protein
LYLSCKLSSSASRTSTRARRESSSVIGAAFAPPGRERLESRFPLLCRDAWRNRNSLSSPGSIKRAEAETAKIAEHQLMLDGINAERERLKMLLEP